MFCTFHTRYNNRANFDLLFSIMWLSEFPQLQFILRSVRSIVLQLMTPWSSVQPASFYILSFYSCEFFTRCGAIALAVLHIMAVCSDTLPTHTIYCWSRSEKSTLAADTNYLYLLFSVAQLVN